MGYKILEKKEEIFFRYIPQKNYRKENKKTTKESPFGVLKGLNFN